VTPHLPSACRVHVQEGSDRPDVRRDGPGEEERQEISRDKLWEWDRQDPADLRLETLPQGLRLRLAGRGMRYDSCGGPIGPDLSSGGERQDMRPIASRDELWERERRD